MGTSTTISGEKDRGTRGPESGWAPSFRKAFSEGSTTRIETRAGQSLGMS